MTDSMDEDDRLLRDRLLVGEATLAEGLRLYESLTTKGLAFPLAWEELVLELGLSEHPDRPDMLARLRHVLTAQGKPVPAAIEQAFARHSAEEERARDHQREAAEYHIRSGMADMDAPFLPIYERCKDYTMTSVERMYALFKAVNYLEEAGIEGDFVECGVWRGGSMMVAASTLSMLGNTNRNLYLFDTYEGLPRPEENQDVDIWGNRAIDGWLPRSVGEEKSHWAEAGVEEVRANLLTTGYPLGRTHFIKGMVERTIPETAPRRIALLRLDTDWYASTKHELEHLYPRLCRHGVLIIDDYGHFKGAKKAVDEFMQNHRVHMLLHRVDYSGRVGIKVTD
jgi:O-methyltransferase